MKKIIVPVLIIFTLTILTGCKEEEDPIVAPSEHFDPEGWIFFYDTTSSPVLYVWQGEILTSWKGNKISDTLNAIVDVASPPIYVNFLDSDQNLIDPPEDKDYEFTWIITDTTYLTLLNHEPGWGFHTQGKQVGNTTLEFQVLHQGHVDVRTPKIPVRINQ